MSKNRTDIKCVSQPHSQLLAFYLLWSQCCGSWQEQSSSLGPGQDCLGLAETFDFPRILESAGQFAERNLQGFSPGTH